MARHDRDEQGAGLDLAANLLVPRVAAAQLVLIEPNLDAKAAQRIGDPTRSVGIFAGIAEKDSRWNRLGHGKVDPTIK